MCRRDQFSPVETCNVSCRLWQSHCAHPAFDHPELCAASSACAGGRSDAPLGTRWKDFQSQASEAQIMEAMRPVGVPRTARSMSIAQAFPRSTRRQRCPVGPPRLLKRLVAPAGEVLYLVCRWVRQGGTAENGLLLKQALGERLTIVEMQLPHMMPVKIRTRFPPRWCRFLRRIGGCCDLRADRAEVAGSMTS